MNEPAITPELVAKHNLTPEEYQKVLEILGREPSYTELGIFSVMWSEHCSYKNTRPVLKTFPTKGDKILVGAGEENAGIIDVGDGLAIAFKIESHNHPSAVEPFQGAATGVGGIIRDIFTMGARPVAALNSLRFGELSNPDVRRLFSGVVNGIAHYGNCFGIPTIAGEVYFDKSYEGNPLVNAFALGVLRHDQITRGAAKGVGNPVFYVGPATGRDGLAGAAFASQDLTEESAEKQRGAVQVGDPFMEKLVCEACLELLATGAVAGMQDMGAAGLTCSTCETAARAGTGIEIELDKVPQRAPNMSSYEIMLSESQERMLIVVHKGREAEVKAVFEKWDLPWSEIGIVTNTGRMIVRHGGKVVVDVPAAKLADEAPIYFRESTEAAYMAGVRAFRLDGIADTKDPVTDLKAILSNHSVASKNWVYRQYDHMVRDGSIVCPGSDAAVIRIKADSVPVLRADMAPTPNVEKYVAFTCDCNGGYVYLDPYEGGKAAIAEACRNLACSGAVPVGSTDNLNFGNPHYPEIFWQLKESVRGMSEGCRVFEAPVTGGNVSLYNQRGALGAIDPTPTVAVVGVIDDPKHITTQWFKDEGDVVVLLGAPVDTADPLQGLGGSTCLKAVHGLKNGLPPRVDLAAAKTLHDTLLKLIRAGLLKGAHDCSEGGLAVALAESCFSRQIAKDTQRFIGASVELPLANGVRTDALLFGETQNRVVISVSPADVEKVLAEAKAAGVPALKIGTVGGDTLSIKAGATHVSAKVAELHDGWWNSIARAMA
jgi:phosphoribosylformylglycinamidine synthase subunit PurL